MQNRLLSDRIILKARGAKSLCDEYSTCCVLGKGGNELHTSDQHGAAHFLSAACNVCPRPWVILEACWRAFHIFVLSTPLQILSKFLLIRRSPTSLPFWIFFTWRHVTFINGTASLVTYIPYFLR
jgi:hypothetical protein